MDIKRNPFWWTYPETRLSFLPATPNEFILETSKIIMIQKATNGDFDLYNRMEFGCLYDELCAKLNINEFWDVLGEPIFTPNMKINGIILYTSIIDFNEDANEYEVVDYNSNEYAVYDLELNLIKENCFKYLSNE